MGCYTKETDWDCTWALPLGVYTHVMGFKQSVAQDLCKLYAEDMLVLPNNLRSDIFVTYDVDILGSHNKRNFSQDEFHGTALSATNPLSWENIGVHRDTI